MLNDIGIDVHNIQSLLTKSSSLGIIGCLEDIYNRRENSVLIGRIEKIYPLIKKSELCTRQCVRVVLKEVCPDGNYGHYFLAVFFNTVAVEIESAKFSVGDKLVFVEPHVFVSPIYRPKNNLHRLQIEIGLIDEHSQTVWFARKFGQEMKLTQGSITSSRSRENRTPANKHTTASNSSSSTKDVTKREEVDETKTHIQKLNGKQSPDSSSMDLDKSCSDCFVLLEDIKVSPQSIVTKSDDNNNKENTPVDGVASRSSSVIVNGRTVQTCEATVNERLNASTENAVKPSVLYDDTREDAVNMGRQKRALDHNKENDLNQKTSESPSWIQKGAKRPQESPGRSLRSTADDKTPTDENRQQNGILTDDKKLLHTLMPSRNKGTTSNEKANNKQIDKLESPSKSNCSTTGEVSKDYGEYITGPEQYDEKLFQNPSVVLKDVAIRKYTAFIKGSVSTESDNNENPEKKMIVSPQEIKNNEKCCQLSADGDEDSSGNSSDSTVDLEGLLTSRKNRRKAVTFTRIDSENKTKKSPNKSVSVFNGETSSVLRDGKRVAKEKENDNREHAVAVVPTPSVSGTHVHATKRKLFSSGSRRDLLLNQQQENSTVLALFEDSEDDEKEISLAHRCDTLNKSSVSQNGICSVGSNTTVIKKSSSISRTTAAAAVGIINDRNQVLEDVVNTSNKQTKQTRDHWSHKDDDDNEYDSKSIIEVINECCSSEVADLKRSYINGGTTSPVLSTRTPPRSQQELIKSHNATSSSSASHNCVDVNSEETEMYITGVKRKIGEATIDQVRVTKMSRLNNAGSRRKNCPVVRNPAGTVREDDMCSGLTGISATGNGGVHHQFVEESCKLSIVTGFIVEILPHALGKCDLIIGHCMTNCGVYRYSELVWFKHEDADKPRCPKCFKQGTTRKVQLMFMFNLTVMTSAGKCYNLLVFDQHAEHFLGCNVQEYLTSKAKRSQIQKTLESYMVNPTSGKTSAQKMRFCVCEVNNVEILVKDITTSSIDDI